MWIFSLLLLASGSSANDDPIKGAFGIDIGSEASSLVNDGFVQLPGRGNSPSNEYVKHDAGSFFFSLRAITTPISKRVISIEGLKFYRSNEIRECMRDKSLIINEIKKKYPKIIKRPAGTFYRDGASFAEFTSRLGKLGFSEGRTINVWCAPQDGGGSALSLTYAGSNAEYEQYRLEQEKALDERSADELAEKGLSSDDL